MNQIYLAIETLVSSSISRSVSWCDFQLPVSNAPNLTSELFFSKPKDIIYCKGFFFNRKSDCFSISRFSI